MEPFGFVSDRGLWKPFVPGQARRKEVNGMKNRKKNVLTKRARIREAAFWKMIRSAETGRQCFS